MPLRHAMSAGCSSIVVTATTTISAARTGETSAIGADRRTAASAAMAFRRGQEVDMIPRFISVVTTVLAYFLHCIDAEDTASRARLFASCRDRAPAAIPRQAGIAG